ncbi:DUF3817 domain-containing protein [Actinomadura meridiana]|uniref:DUF3817 domain-containing protein n=1 Tax=Actinomadura meridiana TaxID=559626 RepID=UPI0031ED3144
MFRWVSIIEAVSFLVLLLVAMPLKYGADVPAAVQVMGPVHGVLFIGYVGLVLVVRAGLRWDVTRTALALAAGVLPVAPFFVEHYWARRPVSVPAS